MDQPDTDTDTNSDTQSDSELDTNSENNDNTALFSVTPADYTDVYETLKREFPITPAVTFVLLITYLTTVIILSLLTTFITAIGVIVGTFATIILVITLHPRGVLTDRDTKTRRSYILLAIILYLFAGVFLADALTPSPA